MNMPNHDVGSDSELISADQAPDFEFALRTSMEQLMARTQGHQAAWDFGSEEEWILDQDEGELTFKFPGRSTMAPVQIIGTYNTQTGVWLWAWANPLIASHMKKDALRLKAYGEQWGIQRLTTAEWAGQESDCWYMAALACRLCNRQGAYRGPAPDSHTLMVFGEVKHNPDLEDRGQILKNFMDESAAEFRAAIENATAQRQAICGFFRRGQVLGLSQAELIDALGLAMPSVLDAAGYLPEESERVMDMVGEISDDEIQNPGVGTLA
ncbi:MAG TPA: hypothetical protein VL361_14355 [Candidatus Limnocylindrales bacterium]|jgi:hypothetical protein|nr:hypothetical protein [Candidatus Limnocylindrales bacterium]